MTIEQLDPDKIEAVETPPSSLRDDTSPPSGEEAVVETEQATGPPVNPVTTTLAAAISTAAAAWMVSGIFRDFTAHFVALAGVLIGGGLVFGSYRIRRAANLQYLVIPLSAVVGIALVAPDAQGGSNGVLGLIEDAVRQGGLLQPPISFDPGWRAILVVLFALLAAGSASLGVSLGRPKLGVALPVPLTMGAALIQPASDEIPAVVVALVLVTVGMTLAYGAELGGSGQLSAAFESRRLLRGGGIAASMAVVVVLLSSLGFLFPQPNTEHIIPPQKPQIPPPQPDRTLFTYSASRPVPLRLGVIDHYDVSQTAWLLPAYDTSRLKRLQAPTKVPQIGGAKFQPGPNDVLVTIRMADSTGHAIPAVAGLGEVRGMNQVITYDPETQSLTLADRPVYNGLSYTVVGSPIATADQLAKSGPLPKYITGFQAKDFLQAPPPPNEVVSLLQQYSERAARLGLPEDPFNRVQFLRTALYDRVVASGPGIPRDVGAPRVAQMLNGADASPYEIVAAEALLARWAGVPSRIGYGYYGGDKQKDGTYAVHPVHGAMWLEVYYAHYGWEPLVGVPPKAKPSTSVHPQNHVNIPAINRIQAIVYIPVRTPTITLLFEYVRWYLLRILPVAALIVLLFAAYPWFFKLIRTRRRRAWAAGQGLPGRIAVAYAEFRDRARDLTIGDPSVTPVRFLKYVARDDEHEELAWLVTRALWGDLRRDLRQEDAESAEKMAASVMKRLDKAQPTVNRVLARIARTSLREPFSREVPNFWYEVRLDLNPRDRWNRWRRERRHRALLKRRALAAATGVIVMVAMLAAACGTVVQAEKARKLPAGLVPAQIGAYQLKFEPAPSRQYRLAGSDALVSDGKVYSISADGATDGVVEVSVFKPDLDISDIDDEYAIQNCAETRNTDDPSVSPVCPGHEVFIGIQKNLGTGHFQRKYYRNYERAYEMDLPDQRIYLWFPPNTQTMVMVVLLGQMGQQASDQLFHALLDYQHHRAVGQVALPTILPASPAPGAQGYGPGAALPTPSPTGGRP